MDSDDCPGATQGAMGKKDFKRWYLLPGSNLPVFVNYTDVNLTSYKNKYTLVHTIFSWLACEI